MKNAVKDTGDAVGRYDVTQFRFGSIQALLCIVMCHVALVFEVI